MLQLYPTLHTLRGVVYVVRSLIGRALGLAIRCFVSKLGLQVPEHGRGHGYGSFDFVFRTISRAFSATLHPILSVCHGLSIVHADWELIGAWDPVL